MGPRVLLTLLPRKDYNVLNHAAQERPNPLTVNRRRLNADWTITKERRN